MVQGRSTALGEELRPAGLLAGIAARLSAETVDDPVREAFFARGLEALGQVAAHLDDSTLRRVVASDRAQTVPAPFGRRL